MIPALRVAISGSRRPAAGRLVTAAAVCLLGTGCIALAIVFGSCALPVLMVAIPAREIVYKVQEADEHSKGPVPESEWNYLGLWYRVSDQPPTYLPKGFGRNRARNGQTGTWVLDARDGKRLFVPNDGANGLSAAVLAAEARKATNWKNR